MAGILTFIRAGVGSSFSPPKYLVPGAQMEIRLSEIGTLKNPVEFA